MSESTASEGAVGRGRTISAEVRQESPSTARGFARTHSVVIDRPVEKGGSDAGAMGGELLLLALGGCFMSNLLAAVRARDIPADSFRVVVEAELDGAPERMTRFTLRVSGRYGERAGIQKLVTIAERACIVANTLRGNAPIEVVVEDPPG